MKKITKYLRLILSVLLITCQGYTQDRIKVACVGDSITKGMGARPQNRGCYPVQLQKLLAETHEVKNFGVNGCTVLQKGTKPYKKEEAYKKALAYNPDIVIIKLGTNDSKGKNWQLKEQFAADLTELAQSFINLSSKPTVYLALPVPVEKSKWSINDKTVKEGIIPIIKTVAEELGCPVIDFYSALPKGEGLSGDGVHPNNEGYKVMAETVRSLLKGGS